MSAEMTRTARGIKVGEARALQELRNHGFTAADDVAEALEYALVKNGVYSASKLLEWMGY